jgi:hypothetical protein
MTEQAPNPDLEKYDRPQNWTEAEDDYQASKQEADRYDQDENKTNQPSP